MSDHRDQIAELIDEAHELEEGAAQIALCEEAVHLADTHQDEAAGFVARKELIQAAMFGGRPDLGLVAFSWCLSLVDGDSPEFDEGELLWQYKWVTQNVDPFPHISRRQIEGLIDDMEVRFKRNGSTLHAVHMIRRDVACALGDRATAEAAHAKFEATKRDHLSDCAACVNDGTIEYHLFLGDDATAVQAARPALDGKVTCAEVPHRTYAYVVLPYLRLGKLERAAKCFKSGYKLVKSNMKFVRHKGYYIAFLALTGNNDRAMRLFERHTHEALETPSVSHRFEYYCACKLFLEPLCGGKATPLVQVPEPLRPDGKPMQPAPVVVEWLDRQINDIARQFDERNGNDGFARRIRWWADHRQYATPFKLDGGGM